MKTFTQEDGIFLLKKVAIKLKIDFHNLRRAEVANLANEIYAAFSDEEKELFDAWFVMEEMTTVEPKFPQLPLKGRPINVSQLANTVHAPSTKHKELIILEGDIIK